MKEVTIRWKVPLLLLFLLSGTLTYLELSSHLYHRTPPGPTPLPGLLPNSTREEKNNINPPDPKLYSSFILQQLQASEDGYQDYVRKRMAYLGTMTLEQVNPWPRHVVMYFWDYFLPSFSCPYSIQRIGSLGDGGKWVCGMELFENEVKEGEGDPPPCIIYSFGVSYESSFENELLSRTPCHVWAYDASVSRMGPQIQQHPHPRVHFHKMYISGEKGGNATLGALMKLNGHSRIDILKMDIEGGEVGVMKEIFDTFDVLPFSQLHLEIHADQEGTSFPSIYRMWEGFEAKGLRAFKNEINNWASIRGKLNPIYIEYSFINIRGSSRLLPNSF